MTVLREVETVYFSIKVVFKFRIVCNLRALKFSFEKIRTCFKQKSCILQKKTPHFVT